MLLVCTALNETPRLPGGHFQVLLNCSMLVSFRLREKTLKECDKMKEYRKKEHHKLWRRHRKDKIKVIILFSDENGGFM